MTAHMARNGALRSLVALLGWQAMVKGDEVLDPIRAHNAIWLAPDAGSFPWNGSRCQVVQHAHHVLHVRLVLRPFVGRGE